MIKTKHVKTKQNLYRMIYQDSGAQMFTANPTHDILLTINVPDFNWAYTRSNKFDKLSMYMEKLISTESCIRFLCTKNLPELNLLLFMLQYKY